MPSYKLIYFNIKGRAEVARLLFAEAGQEYEDKRLKSEEWSQIKKGTKRSNSFRLFILFT